MGGRVHHVKVNKYSEKTQQVREVTRRIDKDMVNVWVSPETTGGMDLVESKGKTM